MSLEGTTRWELRDTPTCVLPQPVSPGGGAPGHDGPAGRGRRDLSARAEGSRPGLRWEGRRRRRALRLHRAPEVISAYVTSAEPAARHRPRRGARSRLREPAPQSRPGDPVRPPTQTVKDIVKEARYALQVGRCGQSRLTPVEASLTGVSVLPGRDRVLVVRCAGLLDGNRFSKINFYVLGCRDLFEPTSPT